jgi:lipopolysaccharide assembly protein A
MPEQIPNQAGTAGTLPPPSVNGSAPPPTAPPPTAAAPVRGRRLRTSISSARTALIVSVLALIVLVIFIIQNADAVKISFLGAQVRVSLAVALLIAAIAGALLMAAAGTARITQLRMVMRRERRRPPQA